MAWKEERSVRAVDRQMHDQGVHGWRRDGSLSLVCERMAGGKVCLRGEDGKELGEGNLIGVGSTASRTETEEIKTLQIKGEEALQEGAQNERPHAGSRNGAVTFSVSLFLSP